MKIAVVGTGYVGLTVGACLSETGNDVTCVDLDQGKIDRLKQGELPIYEPGLEELVVRNAEDGRLKFTTDLTSAVSTAKIVFIAVGTPMDKDGSADLSYVLAAARSIGESMDGYRAIVTKSTVPVGTNEKVAAVLAESTNHEFDVVSNPEFLREGAALDDFMRPDRIVIGVNSDRAAHVMRELYAPFIQTGRSVLFMDPKSAELTKYAANALLATRISFINEIAQICDRVGADVREVRKGIGSDSRLGSAFLFAGAGYGGSCFPKDVRALRVTASENGYEPRIISAAEEVNKAQKEVVFEKIHDHFDGQLEGRRFALWGLAFKPRTDDMREAPSLVLIERLRAAGASVTAFDPVAMEETRRLIGDQINYAETANEALDDADGLIVMTEWAQFRHVDLNVVRECLAGAVMFDGRNIFVPDRVADAGMTYHGIGVPSGTPEPEPALV